MFGAASKLSQVWTLNEIRLAGNGLFKSSGDHDAALHAFLPLGDLKLVGVMSRPMCGGIYGSGGEGVKPDEAAAPHATFRNFKIG